MAVFTQVNQSDLRPALARFGLGDLIKLQGISAGIENTNYFLETCISGQNVQHWVLTIFENLDVKELPYFVHLTRHLALRGLSVPAPLVDKNQEALIDLKGKKAVIVPRLSGESRLNTSSQQCYEVGAWLGKMHCALEDFEEYRPLVRDLEWMLARQTALQDSELPSEDKRLLAEFIDRYEAYRPAIEQCPQGTVHGDLFKDNVLFNDAGIAGVIDFYHACNASLLFDLAVCANDWTTNSHGDHEEDKLAKLVSGYKSQRTWTDKEEQCWSQFLELAALRFWISRLTSKYTSGYQQQEVVEGETIKDPDELKRILLSLRMHP